MRLCVILRRGDATRLRRWFIISLYLRCWFNIPWIWRWGYGFNSVVSAIMGSTVTVVVIIAMVGWFPVVGIWVPIVVVVWDYVILVPAEVIIIELVWVSEVIGVLVLVVRRIQLVVHVQGCGGLICIAYGYLLWRGASEGECKSQNEQ